MNIVDAGRLSANRNIIITINALIAILIICINLYLTYLSDSLFKYLRKNQPIRFNRHIYLKNNVFQQDANQILY